MINPFADAKQAELAKGQNRGTEKPPLVGFPFDQRLADSKISMRKKILLLPFCLLALLISPPSMVMAQETEGSSAGVDRVIVTASPPSMVSPSAADARVRLEATPGAVDLYTDDDYRLGRHDFLDDFLRYQPGLVIQSSQGTEATHVSSRGSGQNNDDISGLTILVDGIPINQGDGEAFLYDVDLQSIKYAEIFRGADALRYGGVTLGGAINLVSATGWNTAPISVATSFGSFGYYQQQLASGYSQGPLDVYAAVTSHLQDGFQDHSQENFQKVTASFGFRLGDAVEDRLYFFYGRLDQNNPAALAKDDLYANPRQTNPEAIQEDWSTRWNYFRFLDRFGVNGKDWSFVAALEYNHRQQTQRQEYEDDFRLGAVRFYSDDYALDFTFESTHELLGGKNRFSAGFIPSFEPESDAFYADPDGKFGALLFADRTYYLNAPLFAENQHYFSKQFSLLTGFQAVFVNRRFRDGFRSPILGDQSHENHYWAFNPKVGVAYQWTDQNLVYLNASRSFQPASFDESIGVREGTDGGEVFHNLESQKGITLEVGTRGESGPLRWDLALYRTWLRDELISLNNSRGVPLGTVNAPDTIHQGIEASLEIELARSLFEGGTHSGHGKTASEPKDGKVVKASDSPERVRKSDRLIIEQTYLLNDFRFDGNAVYGDHRIAGNPVQAYKAELRYEHPCGLYAGPNVEWNVVRYAVDEANTLYSDPYALLGCRVGYKSPRGFQMYVEAKNLTNKIYAAYVEPIADARVGDDNNSFSPGNGRAFYGGVSWSW